MARLQVSGAAAAAITLYTIVKASGTGATPISTTNQAGTQQATPLGVYQGQMERGAASAASGDTGLQIAIGDSDLGYDSGAGIPVIAGASGLALGEEYVAEYSTSRALGVTSASVTLANGDWVLGRVLVAATEGNVARVSFSPYRVRGL